MWLCILYYNRHLQEKNKVPGLLLLSCCTVLYQVFIYTNPGFSILAIDELVITYDCRYQDNDICSLICRQLYFRREIKVLQKLINNNYTLYFYSFKIFSRFLMGQIPRLIDQNQPALTKFKRCWILSLRLTSTVKYKIKLYKEYTDVKSPNGARWLSCVGSAKLAKIGQDFTRFAKNKQQN